MALGVEPGEKTRIPSLPSVDAHTPQAKRTCCAASLRVHGRIAPVRLVSATSEVTVKWPPTISSSRLFADLLVCTPPGKSLSSSTPKAS